MNKSLLFLLFLLISANLNIFNCSQRSLDPDNNIDENRLVKIVGSESYFDIATWNIEHFPIQGSTTISYVAQLIKDMDTNELILQLFESGGFSAKKIGLGVDILQLMINSKNCKKFLSFPACICSTGTRGVIKDLIKYKLVDIGNLTLGEKYELLLTLLNDFRKQHAPEIDNIVFARFLYKTYEQKKTVIPSKRKSEALHKLGLLYTPSSEQEVLYLFSVLHKDIGFPYILKIQEKFPDVTALDKDKNIARIELEVFASDFINHGHDAHKCEFIVCWDNRR